MPRSDPPPEGPAEIVEVRGLAKRFGRIDAVDGVDLTVLEGDVYGFLGPNGAGKTTTLRMLFGLVRPDAGSVRLFGRDPIEDAVSALQGVAGFVETPRFYSYLTGRRNLEWCAALDGGAARDRVERALAAVDLAQRADDRVGGYSFGMRQRLGIAAALLRDPRLLVVDEPTTGLDPPGQRDVRALVRRLAGEGITILLSSHLLAEAEELCDRLAIIRAGRIVYEGSLAELRTTAAGGYRMRTSDDAAALRVCRAQAGVREVTAAEGELRFAAEEPALDRLFFALAEEGVAIRTLVPTSVTLERLFFDLTESPGPAEPVA